MAERNEKTIRSGFYLACPPPRETVDYRYDSLNPIERSWIKERILISKIYNSVNYGSNLKRVVHRLTVSNNRSEYIGFDTFVYVLEIQNGFENQKPVRY